MCEATESTQQGMTHVLSPEEGVVPSYKGAYKQSRSQSLLFKTSVLGKQIHLGSYRPEAAHAGVRLYDSLQLLLHGPRAGTNLKWSAYTQTDITAAAEMLRGKGVNVCEAVLHARGILRLWQLERSWSARFIMVRTQ
jgi:hypothetical protein